MKIENGDLDQDGPNSQESKSTWSDRTITDFTVKTIGSDNNRLTELNNFFNQSQIKSELHWFTHRKTLKRAAEREDRRLFYVCPGEQILAGLMIWCESRVLEPQQSQIRLVAVDPRYRNYGLGRYLVKSAISFANEYNKSEIIADVSADAPAVRFWHSCGFVSGQEYETRGGRTMIRMQRQIEPNK